MRTNIKTKPAPVYTHQGGIATQPSPERDLRRAVYTCMLFEQTFYESGSDIAERINSLCQVVPPEVVAEIAVRTRHELYLRHVSLYLAAILAKMRRPWVGPGGGEKSYIGDTIADVVARADEPGEFLAILQKLNPGIPLGRLVHGQVRRGLDLALRKFDAYQLGKYRKMGDLNLRHVFRLVRPMPETKAQGKLWGSVVGDSMPPPETWESKMVRGGDKKATFEKLLFTGKLGYMATIRNLRNMIEAGVDSNLITITIARGAAGSKMLPFRFLSAVKHAPRFASELSDAMVSSASSLPKLGGYTHIIIDISGSMDDPISGKSELKRWEAAAGVAILARELCGRIRIFTFSCELKEVPAYRGIPLSEAICNSQAHGSTYLSRAIDTLPDKPDRTIIITDEQSHDGLPRCPSPLGYLINVAAYKPALPAEDRGWKRISGFSERILEWIGLEEQ